MTRNPLVPAQITGTKTDTEHTVRTDSPETAAQLFQLAGARLLDVNNWQQLCGSVMSASFQLTDTTGRPLNRCATTGDHIRIDLPSPGPQSGHGFDWVKIEKIEEAHSHDNLMAYIAMQVRPTQQPGHQQRAVAHFFKNFATSSFVIRLQHAQVTASVHGRNEHPNTATGNWLDKLRNILIGWGAKIGLSGPQWKCLAKGLLKRKT